jgi:hypothetical protein
VNNHYFWLGKRADESPCAYLAISSDEFQRGLYPQDLKVGLYDGDEIWYLPVQSTHVILENSQVSLFDHEHVLFTYSVDEAWMAQARADGGFVLMLCAPSRLHRLLLEELDMVQDDGHLKPDLQLERPT